MNMHPNGNCHNIISIISPRTASVAHVDALIEDVACNLAEQAAARLQPVRSESRNIRSVALAPAYTQSPTPSPTLTRSYDQY